MTTHDESIGKNLPTAPTTRKPYQNPHRTNSLSLDEQERLLASLDCLEDMALFRLALTTGIRREDIVSIDIGRIDFELRRLTFWEAKKNRDWVVPLTEDTIQVLKMLVNTRKGKQRLFDFSGRTAYNRLQRALDRAGIKKELSFHDLRRTFVKTAKKRGLSIKAVSQITGDTYRVIEEHYENLDQDELREEIDKL